MPIITVPANTVSLTDDTVRITVRTLEHASHPQTVDYRGSDGAERRFAADEVAVAGTPIGDWYTVTVAVHQTEQGQWGTLVTVLIPHITVQPHFLDRVTLSTVGVETVALVDRSYPERSTHRTFSIDGEAHRS